uniref:Uncharacterized protein n=1 Tax=Anguilla anguilla TaxID=7936 RepID=A0A0E9SJU9_ANGAN
MSRVFTLTFNTSLLARDCGTYDTNVQCYSWGGITDAY